MCTSIDNENGYRTIIENAGEAVVIIRRGKIRFSNARARELSGYSADELSRIPCLELIHPDDREIVLAQYKKTLRNERAVNPYYFRMRNPGGQQRWSEISHRQIDWQGRKAVLAFVSDITERKHLEQQFFQAQKMEAVGRIAGGIAHDFNNILTVILGYTELLQNHAKEKGAEKPHIEAIREAAKKGSSLTQNLLAFSRKQLLEPKVIDLNSLITGMDSMLKRLLGESIELEKKLDRNLGSVHADSGQIEQVILNLAVNSKDAMEKGGRLVIETSNTKFANRSVQTKPEMPPGRYVMLTLSDTGTGMDEDTKSHLFEPFFTTKESGRGTGLGLATVYGTVKQSAGFIYVYSEPGQGTTFKLYFPRIDLKPTEISITATPRRRLGGTETILVLDDEQSLLKLIRSMLDRNGYRVLTASGAEEALSICRDCAEPIDLLIADIGIPGMNGRQVWEAVKKRYPQVRVLFISGYPQDFLSIRDISEGKHLFLQKPFGSETLLQRIRATLDQDENSGRN